MRASALPEGWRALSLVGLRRAGLLAAVEDMKDVHGLKHPVFVGSGRAFEQRMFAVAVQVPFGPKGDERGAFVGPAKVATVLLRKKRIAEADRTRLVAEGLPGSGTLDAFGSEVDVERGGGSFLRSRAGGTGKTPGDPVAVLVTKRAAVVRRREIVEGLKLPARFGGLAGPKFSEKGWDEDGKHQSDQADTDRDLDEGEALGSEALSC